MKFPFSNLNFLVSLTVILLSSRVIAQVHPGMPNLLPRQQAESLLINRDYNEAIKLYRQLIQDNPEDGFLFRGLVKACQGASKMDEAETWLNNFLSTGAHPDNALYGLGYLKYLTNRLKDSEFFLLKAVKVNPKHALAQNNLGAIFSDKEEFEKAEVRIKEAIRLDATQSMFFENLLMLYQRQGKIDRFRDEYKNTQRSGSHDLATGYGKVLARQLRQKGFQAYAKGNPQETLVKTQEMLTIYQGIQHESGIVQSLFSLGLLHEEMQDDVKALSYFKEVLKRNPNHLQAGERIDKIKQKMK